MLKKYLHKLIVILCFCMLLPGCKSKQVDDKWQGLECEISAEHVNSSIPLLELNHITLFKNYMIIKLYDNGKMFSLFKIHDDSIKYVDSFLHRGNGPMELNNAYLHYIHEENALVAIGYNSFGKNIVIPVDDITNIFDVGTWRTYTNGITYNAFDVIPMDSISYIARMDNNDNVLMSSFSSADCQLIELLNYPDDIKVDGFEKGTRAYGGWTIKRPNHKDFVYSSWIGNYVNIFSVDDHVVTKEIELFSELPKYSASGDGKVIRDPSCKFGLPVNVTESYIYLGDPKVLYNDSYSDSKAKNGYPSGYVTEIYVSDWAGNPRVKYLLDEPVVFFVIDEKDEYLYGYVYDEDNEISEKIVRFKLPEK